MLRVTIFGTGYVGLVTGACLAAVGHEVCCVDVDAAKVARLEQGEVPIYEPGLEDYVSRARAQGRLRFTTDADQAVAFADILFIAVGTPPDEDGSADLRHVLEVARGIGQRMSNAKLVITKSTVPVGTSDRVREAIATTLAERGVSLDYEVASNPEFLKEGAAIEDFMRPDRIIVGTGSEAVRERMRMLYKPFNRQRDRLVFMDVRSAELTKYAANAMLATKISFMNEIANLAERLGADVEQVRVGIGSDPRIGYHFIYPGCGYGGSCFPKDVQALARTAGDVGYQAQLLDAVEAVNQRQKMRLFELVAYHFGHDLQGRTIALWGLAFKPRTDDMREAPSRVLMEALWQAGARVRAYDPEAMAEARRLYPAEDRLELVDEQMAALDGADCLVVCTEWKSFWAPDFDAVKAQLRQPMIVDGRNLYDPEALAARGICYYGIGRGASIEMSRR